MNRILDRQVILNRYFDVITFVDGD